LNPAENEENMKLRKNQHGHFETFDKSVNKGGVVIETTPVTWNGDLHFL
jgi:hypothetical protein